MQKENSLSSSLKSVFTLVAMIVAFVVATIIYAYVLGAGSNFQGGNHDNQPLSGNYMGVVYKGGPIVPFLIGLFLIVIIFSVERALTVLRSRGTGNPDAFLRRIKMYLASGDLNAAIAECDKQKGSIGNVVKTGLLRYQAVSKDASLDRDAKLAAIQKEIEEATSLELPMLERNLVIISTIASIATLTGLFGTVLGMIRAFAALANSGAPDAAALATGISEALINTAFGIGTSGLAIILYNYFTNTIDGITYRIDEAGFSIAQSFAANYRETSVKDKSNTYA